MDKITKPTPPALAKAAKIIKQGGLVVFPTETVYGLGANALNASAVRKIFKAKQRPPDNPLIVHIADPEDLKEIAKDIPPAARKLMKLFWPGPLTLILNKRRTVPKIVTAGLNTVAVRMPKSKIALALIKKSGLPIAAPSANKSGRPSATIARDAYHDLKDSVEIILDGGATKVGIESTVLDLTRTVPVILRPGFITRYALSRALGKPIRIAKKTARKPASPGMKYRHYAPRAPLFLVSDPKKFTSIIKRFKRQKKRVCVLVTGRKKYPGTITISLGSRRNLSGIAKNLFRALRSCDQKNAGIIISETFPEKGIGIALMNRLQKAAKRTL